MSKIIGYYNFLPDLKAAPIKNLEYQYKDKKIFISRTQSIIDHPPLYLSSRNATFLVYSVTEAISRFKTMNLESPFDAGIYCAIEGGSLDYFTASLLNSTQPMPVDTQIYYENLMKNSPSIMAGLVGIQTKIMGPVLTYPSRQYGILHALEQAELHLYFGKVKKAIVATCFGFDDPILQIKERKLLKNDQILSEGAAALLLEANESRTDWHALLNTKPSPVSYGISTALVQFIKDLENEK